MKNPFSTPKLKFFLVAIFIALVYAAIRLPYIDVPLNRDEGLYAYGGRLILQGKLPCKDIPDYNPPLVFLLNAIMLLFVKTSPRAIHSFHYAYNFSTMLCLYYFSFRYFKSRRAGLWTALVFAIFTASPTVLGFAATSEHSTLLPIAASLLTAYLGVIKKNKKYIFLSGNLAAAACWIKQQVGFSAFAILFFIIFELYRRRKRREISTGEVLSGVAMWISGTFFITGAISAYYYFHGGLGDLFYWAFLQGFHYSDNAAGIEIVSILFSEGIEILKSNGFLFAAALGGGILGWAQKDKRALAPFALLMLSSIGVFFGRAYPHYFIQIAPGLAISSGIFLDKMLRKKKILTIAALCALAFGLYVDHWGNLILTPSEISNRYFPGNPFPISNLVSKLIASKTNKNDKLLIVGSEPQIFLRSNRHSATSFLTITTLTENFPRHQEFQEKYWKEIQESDPPYIVFVNLAMSICWDGKANFTLFDRILDLINRDYELKWAFMVKQGWHFMEIKPFTRHIYIFKKKA